MASGESGMALRSPRRRGLLRLAIGRLLVSTPLWAPALHLTGDRVTYRATTVEPAPDEPGFAFGTDDVRLRTAFDEVACYGGVDLPRTCALEPVPVNGSPDVTSGERPVYWDARFVYLRGSNEGFYRRTRLVTRDPVAARAVEVVAVLAGVLVLVGGRDWTAEEETRPDGAG
jgi:hypothetical protein